MQCNITFDLDSPEDRTHHLRCTKALDLTLCLNEFNNQLLAQLKYDELSGKEKIILSNVNELLQDTMKEYGIDLDTLLR